MRAAFLALILLCSTAALAVEPTEMLADPALEARARELSRELRCVVCQNQSIDESDAEMAADMRRLVRDRITAGESDKDIIAYLVGRYGDIIRLKTPFDARTYLLWATPLAVFAVGLAIVVATLRRQSRSEEAEALEDDGTINPAPPEARRRAP